MEMADLNSLHRKVTLELGTGYQNLINSVWCPKKTIYGDWPESIVQFKK